MYPVTPELYQRTTALLIDAIGCRGYYSGTLVFGFDEVDCRLTASVIVCRERVSLPEGVSDQIVDLVPVWWEFHTVGADGEFINDFAFSEIKYFV